MQNCTALGLEVLPTLLNSSRPCSNLLFLAVESCVILKVTRPALRCSTVVFTEIVPHIALPPSMGILSGACSALGKHLRGFCKLGWAGEWSPGMLAVSYPLPFLSSAYVSLAPVSNCLPVRIHALGVTITSWVGSAGKC